MKNIFFLFVAIASPISAAASGDEAKISPSLRSTMALADEADVLVYFRAKPDLSGAEKISDRPKRIQHVFNQLLVTAESSQSSAIEILKNARAPYRAFHIVNALQVPRANLSLLHSLSTLPEVKRIVANTAFTLSTPQPILPPESDQSDRDIPASLKAIGVDRVWNELGIKGEGIVIAGQDGGYAWQHPALRRQYRGTIGLNVNHNFNWHDAIHRKPSQASGCRPDSPEPCDDTGHGTHTMGTMVGDDGGPNRIGVAPGAQWIGCRNMDRGAGTAATYLECFEFFLAPYPVGGNSRKDARPELAPHIINNSWACPPSEGCSGEEFLGAVRALKAAGIAVVVAAGNEGPGCGSIQNPPGSYATEVISVASFDHRSGDSSSFSSRGPSGWNGDYGPMVTAPGNLIRSSVPGGGSSSNPLYDYKAGTSMASPHVAGVLALLWSKNPSLIGNVEESAALLQRGATAKKTSQNCGRFSGQQIPNAVFGFGILNAYKTLNP